MSAKTSADIPFHLDSLLVFWKVLEYNSINLHKEGADLP